MSLKSDPLKIRPIFSFLLYVVKENDGLFWLCVSEQSVPFCVLFYAFIS